MKTLFILLALALSVASAGAQTIVKNPTKAIFNPGPDNALITSYEIDIIKTDGTVAQTLSFPKQAVDANGEVTLSINVQPVAFGDYTAVVRNVFGAYKSINSAPSDLWQRVPGQGGKPKMQ